MTVHYTSRHSKGTGFCFFGSEVRKIFKSSSGRPAQGSHKARFSNMQSDTIVRIFSNLLCRKIPEEIPITETAPNHFFAHLRTLKTELLQNKFFSFSREMSDSAKKALEGR